MPPEFNYTADDEEQIVPDGEDEGEPQVPPSDPLKDLDVSQLLNHPDIGPRIQSWADRATAAQITAAVNKTKSDMENEARLAGLQARFESMSEEELGRVLSNDPEMKKAYVALQQRLDESANQESQEEISRVAQTYGYAIQVAHFQKLLEGSDLEPEKLKELAPDNFTQEGPQGIVSWGNAIYRALVEKEAEALTATQLEARWEAYLEERMAEIESGGRNRTSTLSANGVSNGADITSGRVRGPVTQDMLKTMTTEQVLAIPKEQRYAALTESKKKK